MISMSDAKLNMASTGYRSREPSRRDAAPAYSPCPVGRGGVRGRKAL
jgi:hypothetical protein